MGGEVVQRVETQEWLDPTGLVTNALYGRGYNRVDLELRDDTLLVVGRKGSTQFDLSRCTLRFARNELLQMGAFGSVLQIVSRERVLNIGMQKLLPRTCYTLDSIWQCDLLCNDPERLLTMLDPYLPSLAGMQQHQATGVWKSASGSYIFKVGINTTGQSLVPVMVCAGLGFPLAAGLLGFVIDSVVEPVAVAPESFLLAGVGVLLLVVIFLVGGVAGIRWLRQDTRFELKLKGSELTLVDRHAKKVLWTQLAEHVPALALVYVHEFGNATRTSAAVSIPGPDEKPIVIASSGILPSVFNCPPAPVGTPQYTMGSAEFGKLVHALGLTETVPGTPEMTLKDAIDANIG